MPPVLPIPSPTVEITCYAQVAHTERLTAALDAIFFEASATTAFASPAAKAAFRRRWLGRYLDAHPEAAFLALVSPSREVPARQDVAGYLVGSLVDPALDPANADLDYVGRFATLSAQYPAHLHINLAAPHRSGGLGARLLDAFADHARSRGARGFHVVTAKGMRNVGFYLKNGFNVLGETDWNARTLLFLVRTC